MTMAPSAPNSTVERESLETRGQYVSFRVDGQLLGIPVATVQEVLNTQSIAKAPLARPEIAGLLNLRGQIVTAFNLRRRLGLPETAAPEDGMNVVVRHGGESYSLLVDEVGDVLNIAEHELLPAPRTLDAHWKSVTCGVFRLEDELFVILDVNALLKLD